MRLPKHSLSTLLLTAGLGFAASASASLESRIGGFVYDTDRNLTWTQDGNLFQTLAEGNPGLVNQVIASVGGVIHETPDDFNPTGIHALSTGDFDAATGDVNWWGAQAWVEYLNSVSHGGYGDWRLPNAAPDAGSVAESNSELGHLFYAELGGQAGNEITAIHSANYDLLDNVQSQVYWTGTEYAPSPDLAWGFDTSNGSQGSYYDKQIQRAAWAVRSGDVAAVPVPAAVWLFGSALAGLGLVARRGKTASATG